MFFALPAQAEIYKWVDEKGNVHFGDKPVANSEEIVIPEQTNVQNRPSKEERGDRRKRLLDSFAEDRADRKELQAKQKKQKKKLDRQCAIARDKMKIYNRSRRLYDLDEKGERVILSDKARQQAVEQLAADINKHCK
ncbi:MAG: DUF4124 domain-containing protein [Gammaproteobacteria bacterium]